MKVRLIAKRRQEFLFKSMKILCNSEAVAIKYKVEIERASVTVRDRQRQIAENRIKQKISFAEPIDGILAGR